MGSGNPTWIIRIGGKHPYPWRHLASSLLAIKNIKQIKTKPNTALYWLGLKVFLHGPSGDRELQTELWISKGRHTPLHTRLVTFSPWPPHSWMYNTIHGAINCLTRTKKNKTDWNQEERKLMKRAKGWLHLFTGEDIWSLKFGAG